MARRDSVDGSTRHDCAWRRPRDRATAARRPRDRAPRPRACVCSSSHRAAHARPRAPKLLDRRRARRRMQAAVGADGHVAAACTAHVRMDDSARRYVGYFGPGRAQAGNACLRWRVAQASPRRTLCPCLCARALYPLSRASCVGALLPGSQAGGGVSRSASVAQLASFRPQARRARDKSAHAQLSEYTARCTRAPPTCCRATSGCTRTHLVLAFQRLVDAPKDARTGAGPDAGQDAWPRARHRPRHWPRHRKGALQPCRRCAAPARLPPGSRDDPVTLL